MKLELHGLVFDSDIAFVAHNPPAGATPDVTIRRSTRTFPDSGEILASLEPGYRIVRDAGSYYLRFLDACDFGISHDGTRIEVTSAPGADPELVSLLLGGGGLSLAMMLRDLNVLHASAVELEPGVGVAFVGSSGMGKSTVAGAVCAAGGALVTDDVLRVAPGPRGVRYFRGSPELRLRGNAEALVELIPASGRRRTCDARVAVRVERGVRPTGTLDAIVVPCLGAVPRGLEMRRLPDAEAVLMLLKHPRFPGWRNRDWGAWHLRHAAALARTLPVFEASLPRFEHFSPELGAILVEALLDSLCRA